MAVRKLLGTFYLDAASNTTMSSQMYIPSDFTNFSLEVPTAAVWTNNSAVAITLLWAAASGGTFRGVYYDASSYSGTAENSLFALSSTMTTAGGMTKFPAVDYAAGGFAKLLFTKTCTANVGWNLWGMNY